MIRPIIQDINFLKQRSEPIDKNDPLLPQLIKDLEDTLKNNGHGIGLSAIQIGIPKCISIIRIGETKINLVNPIILEKEEPFRFHNESCLSFSGIFCDTKRYNYIKVNNNGQIFVAERLEAVCIQHELSHLWGRIFFKDDKWHGK